MGLDLLVSTQETPLGTYRRIWRVLGTAYGASTGGIWVSDCNSICSHILVRAGTTPVPQKIEKAPKLNAVQFSIAAAVLATFFTSPSLLWGLPVEHEGVGKTLD